MITIITRDIVIGFQGIQKDLHIFLGDHPISKPGVKNQLPPILSSFSQTAIPYRYLREEDRPELGLKFVLLHPKNVWVFGPLLCVTLNVITSKSNLAVFVSILQIDWENSIRLFGLMTFKLYLVHKGSDLIILPAGAQTDQPAELLALHMFRLLDVDKADVV